MNYINLELHPSSLYDGLRPSNRFMNLDDLESRIGLLEQILEFFCLTLARVQQLQHSDVKMPETQSATRHSISR